MCGIGGWVCFGKKLPPEETADRLLTSLEERGKVASGVIWALDWERKAGFLKHCVAGSQLLKMEQAKPYLEQVKMSRICLLHTRFPTQGPPSDHKNNHPVFRTAGKYAVVHNGSIWNDDVIFDKLKLKREAEVDTEALVALLDTGKTPKESLDQLGKALGSFAIAAVPYKKVDHIILARHTSPIVWLYDATNSILYFTSTVASLCTIFDARVDERAARLGIKQSTMNMPSEFVDDDYWVITKDGVIADGKLNFDMTWRKIYAHGRRQTWNQTTRKWEFEDGTTAPQSMSTVDSNFTGPHLYNDTRPLPMPMPKASKPLSGLTSLVEMISGTPLVSPDVGAWDKEKLHLRSCRGFYTPPIVGMYEHMYKFPVFTFPDVKSTSYGDGLVMCPACLLHSYATQFFDLGFKCPECKTQLLEPKEVRPLSEAERNVSRQKQNSVRLGGDGV